MLETFENSYEPSATQNFIRNAQGILDMACGYCIATRRWCIL